MIQEVALESKSEEHLTKNQKHRLRKKLARRHKAAETQSELPGRLPFTGLKPASKECSIEANIYCAKRRRLEGPQQTDSNKSSQLGMHLWQEGKTDLPSCDQQQNHKLPGSSRLPRRHSAADTPLHSDCCSDNALSPREAIDSCAAQISHPHNLRHVQSDWRLQQEHQILAPVSLPAPQIMQPAHIESSRRNEAASLPSTGGMPSRADFSWPMAVMSASLPSKQHLQPAAALRRHEHGAPQEFAHAEAQPASPAGHDELHTFHKVLHASEQMSSSHATDFQQQQQQRRQHKRWKLQQQQQHDNRTIAVHASQQSCVAPAPAADSVQRQQQHEQQKPQQQGQQKAKFVAVHGNYHRYYGTRKVADFEADPRLKIMEKPWFQNRKCLDIGCNEGMITLALASYFGTAIMLGVDIDKSLVGKASSHLAEQRSKATADLARASHTRQGPAPGSASNDADKRQPSPQSLRKAASTAVQGLRGTFFQHGSFLELDLEPGSFDTITCFSVTKWVHLNGGDEALQALLAKVYGLLAPGGRFVVEPQQWVSYKKALRKPGVSAQLQRTLEDLHMLPEDIPQYMSDVLGFKLVRELRRTASGEGFDRPIFLFRKPG